MYQGTYRLVGIDYGKEEWVPPRSKEGYYISDIFLGFGDPSLVHCAQEGGVRKDVGDLRLSTPYVFNELWKRCDRKKGSLHPESQESSRRTPLWR